MRRRTDWTMQLIGSEQTENSLNYLIFPRISGQLSVPCNLRKKVTITYGHSTYATFNGMVGRTADVVAEGSVSSCFVVTCHRYEDDIEI